MDGGEPVLLEMGVCEKANDLVCYVALYQNSGKMAMVTRTVFRDDGMDAYLAEIDPGQRGYATGRIIEIGDDYAPVCEMIPVP